MSFGKKLLELRQARHMDRRELSMITGLTRQQISHYEQDLNGPHLSTAILLADALDVSLDELAERTQTAPPFGDESLQDLGYTEELSNEDRVLYTRLSDNNVIKFLTVGGETAVYKFNLHRPGTRLDLTFAEVTACSEFIRARAKRP